MTGKCAIFTLSKDSVYDALVNGGEADTCTLISFASTYGISGDVVRSYIAYLLILQENAFSLQCERGKIPEGSLYGAALQDMESVYAVYNDTLAHARLYSPLVDWKGEKADKYYTEAGDIIRSLTLALDGCSDHRGFTRALADHYRIHGAGPMALGYAFRLKENSSDVEPIILGGTHRMSDLIGLESQKKALISNTKALLEGKPANNVLLYGDGGTGKTTSVKALLSEFGSDRLRIIEIYKHQFRFMNGLIGEIKHRGYKFILFLDDLSFEEGEVEYKYLKAVIEGGLEPRPDNVLIYATSNRRHIVRESWKDRDDGDDDLHRYDTVEEKLSLVKRFGLSLYYPSPDQKEYLDIVHFLAENAGIPVSAELDREALIWEKREGGMSGRTAGQFINRLIAELRG